MQTVTKHLIQQEEIPATPHSPALTSSSIASPKCQVYHPQDELQPNTLHTDSMEKMKNMSSCISSSLSNWWNTHKNMQSVLGKLKNLVKIDGFVKSVGFQCTQDYVTQDHTHWNNISQYVLHPVRIWWTYLYSFLKIKDVKEWCF